MRRLALFICVTGLGIAVPASATNTFIESHEEGWFWYKSDEVAPPPPPPPRIAEQAPPPPAQGAPMSAAWLRAQIPMALDNALDQQTPEAVATYFYLQRAAVDKASRFSSIAQEVVAGDPGLDEATRRPLASYGAREMDREAGENRSEALKAVAQRAAILFFFESTCPHCAAQAPVLQAFAKNYGFIVKAVSLDNRPMPNGLFTNFVPDTGGAKKLGVSMTPAMFLLHPPDGQAVIGEGALSYSELQARVLLAAKRLGVLSPEDLERTKPVREQGSLAAVNAPAATAQNSNALLEHLRNSVRIRQ